MALGGEKPRPTPEPPPGAADGPGTPVGPAGLPLTEVRREELTPVALTPPAGDRCCCCCACSPYVGCAVDAAAGAADRSIPNGPSVTLATEICRPADGGGCSAAALPPDASQPPAEAAGTPGGGASKRALAPPAPMPMPMTLALLLLLLPGKPNPMSAAGTPPPRPSPKVPGPPGPPTDRGSDMAAASSGMSNGLADSEGSRFTPIAAEPDDDDDDEPAPAPEAAAPTPRMPAPDDEDEPAPAPAPAPLAPEPPASGVGEPAESAMIAGAKVVSTVGLRSRPCSASTSAASCAAWTFVGSFAATAKGSTMRLRMTSTSSMFWRPLSARTACA